ncbi:MAG: DMT family transporter [Pseudomonadota bacterium]
MPAETAQPQSLLAPSLGLVLGGALWGLMWLPLRGLEDMGLTGAWPAAMMFGGTCALFLPFMAWRWRRLAAVWLPLALSGLFTGMAVSFYAVSIALTDVVRAILLFYLTPVWGTALGMAVLGERLTVFRIAAIVAGLAGLFTVLGDAGLPLPSNAGDWLALASGIAWAFGSLAVYRSGGLGVGEQMAAFVIGGLGVTVFSIALGGPTFGGLAALETVIDTAPWALLSGVYLLPVLFLTLWPASLLTPGRVGLLLLSEVAVGVASAALLTDEPFGTREMIGTALIIAAGAIAVLERPTH